MPQRKAKHKDSEHSENKLVIESIKIKMFQDLQTMQPSSSVISKQNLHLLMIHYHVRIYRRISTLEGCVIVSFIETTPSQ